MSDRGVTLLKRLVGAWRDIAGSLSNGGITPNLSAAGDAKTLQQQMRACLEGHGGEVTARANAARLGRTYLELDADGRRKFLRILAEEFGTNPKEVDAAVENLRTAGADKRSAAEAALRQTLFAPRRTLLRQFNALPQGVKFLVDLREDILDCLDEPSMKELNEDVRQLLASWFDIGFLELQRITWDSPASLLEKLIEYEAVHEVRSWDDLKNRLAQDRRLYAFFHPRMPDEPLIFVQVALVNGLADNVAVLLDETAPTADPAHADTAIFYSITNAQRGLVGISFGDFLIKRVVDTLAAEFKGLNTFSTLSPIPGFLRWIRRELENGAKILTAEESNELAEEFVTADGHDVLKEILDDNGWVNESGKAEALRPVLTRLAAHYLLHEKRRGQNAADPVAHFHLTNGARVERLNWMGDSSKNGLKQSAGMMVNYLYDLSKIVDNHQTYTGKGVVKASAAIEKLAKK